MGCKRLKGTHRIGFGWLNSKIEVSMLFGMRGKLSESKDVVEMEDDDAKAEGSQELGT
jgi:hypothetical protein